MKRSRALAPLSRDHHVALVVAAALQHAGPDDLNTAVARFADFFANHELSHFALEEGVLLPAADDDETGRALVARVLADHDYLRDAWRRLRRADEPPDLEFARAIGARLRDHVRLEERELFPYLERSLDAARLEEIGARLNQDPT